MPCFIRYRYHDSNQIGLQIGNLVYPLHHILAEEKPITDLVDQMDKLILQDLDALTRAADNLESAASMRSTEARKRPIKNRTRSRDLMTKASASLDIEDLEVLPPFQKLAHDLICVGVNYQAHRDEGPRDWAKQEAPVFFGKRAYELRGSGQDLSIDFAVDQKIDYEAELAVVIGKLGKNIPAEEALDYVFGYTIVNDLSARSLQSLHSQWYKGKSLDGLTSLGPGIVPKSRIPDPQNLQIKSYVNGDLRQNGHTSEMIYSVAEIISVLSQGMTLEPGDVIATGTPAGVALGRPSQDYLQAGDMVVCEIEGIGRLVNVIRDASK